MSDERCPECGCEAWDETVEPGYRGGMCTGTGSPGCREALSELDSAGRYFRARALAAESRLAASPRAPTPEVLRAAEEVAQLAQRRTTLRDEQTKAPPREQDYIAHLLDAAEDRMVQLAVVLAKWVKGGEK